MTNSVNTGNKETHPLAPFLPEGARILMLGSFPPARSRWGMEFYYPNFQNDMWRILGLAFFGNRDRFLVPGEKRFDKGAIERFCRDKGIALSDVAEEAVRLRDNASDQFLHIVRPRDIAALLDKIPECSTVAVTGQKACDTFCAAMGCREPAVGGSVPFVCVGKSMELWRMPSSSRAYPKPTEEKAEMYRRMFASVGML